MRPARIVDETSEWASRHVSRLEGLTAKLESRFGGSRGAVELFVGMVGLALVGVLGWIHSQVRRGLSFELFYLLVCILVGWVGRVRPVVVCVLAASVVSGVAGSRSSGFSGTDWTLVWNSVMRFLTLAAAGWLAVRGLKRTRDLEGMVEQWAGRLRTEVAEHKQTAEWLRESIEVWRQVTENITDVFWVTDVARTHFEYVSPGFERVWAKSRRDLYDSPSAWLESVHPEDRERVTRALLTQPLRGDYDEEYRIVPPGGGIRWVHDRAFPVKDEQGAFYRIVGITEDITERKRAEKVLEAQRDLGVTLSSTSDLSAALDRLLEIALQLEGIDCGGVYLVEPPGGELRLAAHRGLSGAFVQRVAHCRADAFETRLAKAGSITYVRQEQIPRGLELLWGSEGIRALALVPVRHQGSVLGLLSLASYRHDEISPRTRVGIELIAAQVAGGIARIRTEDALRRNEAHRARLQREVLEISDREQARMGQDIHDGLCQQLIGMAFSANSLERDLSAESHQGAATAGKLCQLLDDTIDESRRVCRRPWRNWWPCH